MRRARVEDAAGILDCLATAFSPYEASYTPAAYVDTVLTAESIVGRLEAMHVFVAVGDGDAIVGTIACAMVDETEGHLRGMAVVPVWQGHGIAERLLQAAEADLVVQGCVRITLDTTEPLQRAMRFYEKHGYRRSGRVTDFFGLALHEYVKKIDAQRR